MSSSSGSRARHRRAAAPRDGGRPRPARPALVFDAPAPLGRYLAVVEGPDVPSFHVASRGAQGFEGSAGSNGSTAASGGECGSGGNGSDGGQRRQRRPGRQRRRRRRPGRVRRRRCVRPRGRPARGRRSSARQATAARAAPGGARRPGRARRHPAAPPRTHTDENGNTVTDDAGCSGGSDGSSGATAQRQRRARRATRAAWASRPRADPKGRGHPSAEPSASAAVPATAAFATQRPSTPGSRAARICARSSSETASPRARSTAKSASSGSPRACPRARLGAHRVEALVTAPLQQVAQRRLVRRLAVVERQHRHRVLEDPGRHELFARLGQPHATARLVDLHPPRPESRTTQTCFVPPRAARRSSFPALPRPGRCRRTPPRAAAPRAPSPARSAKSPTDTSGARRWAWDPWRTPRPPRRTSRPGPSPAPRRRSGSGAAATPGGQAEHGVAVRELVRRAFADLVGPEGAGRQEGSRRHRGEDTTLAVGGSSGGEGSRWFRTAVSARRSAVSARYPAASPGRPAVSARRSAISVCRTATSAYRTGIPGRRGASSVSRTERSPGRAAIRQAVPQSREDTPRLRHGVPAFR